MQALDEEQIDLRAVLDLLRRKIWLILIVASAGMVVAAGAISAMPLRYTASALILVDTAGRDVLDGGRVQPSAGWDNARVESEVEILRSQPILLEALERSDLQRDPSFQPMPGWGQRLSAIFGLGPGVAPTEAEKRDAAIERLRSALLVQRRGLTYVIAVNATADAPQLAARMANAVAEAHIALQTEDKERGIRMTLTLLEARLSQAASDLNSSKAALDIFLHRTLPLAAEREERPDAIQATAGGFHGELVSSDSIGQQDTGAGEAIVATDLPPTMLASFFALQESVALAQSNYRQLLKRTNELRLDAELQIADSRIIAAAALPSMPSSPSRRLLLALAFVACLGIGVGSAFANDALTGGFTSQEQMEATTGHPVLTSVPMEKMAPTGAASLADSVVLAPRAPFAEAMRHLQLGLDQTLGSGQGVFAGKVVLVTSAMPREGKTTSALALARTYAQAGKRVILVEADLRTPELHRHLGETGHGGLVDFLLGDEGGGHQKPLVTADPMSGAWAILGAAGKENGAEQLLGGRGFAALIDTARRHYDIILIDTPSVSLAADGAYLLRYADAVLVLVRHALTPQRSLLRSLTLLERANFAQVPIVLTLVASPNA